MGKPTIADLAKAAGVSVTTVSHAFSGRRYVEPETRKRIETLAQEMGYRPNHRAQRLRTGRAGSIALVSSMPFAVAAGPSRLGFLMEIAAAAAVTAFARGISLCLVPPLGPRDRLDALEVDGAIVVEPERDDPVLDFFSSRGTEVVCIGRAPGRDDLPFVDLQSAATAHLLLDHLLAGDGQVGLITGEQRRNSYIEMEAVYAQRMAGSGFTPRAIRIDEQGGEEAAAIAAESLLRANPSISALCVPVDAFATGVLNAARATGRQIPHDLRIATRYDGMRAKLATPPLTAVDLHLGEVAGAAVNLLLARLEQVNVEPSDLSPPGLILRPSSMISCDTI
ncbi:LacI family transcriptional regulator (plasmid) [Ensifer adhaerens]|uniref:Substrate-binding domain-containing protein n=1 Tax=Ensifer adhaerens TaxID=106592 RepID=A0ABY8HT22_ENSAD|nr:MULTISPECIES: substrate-binding domain-containing protein [Ensifer]OWZ90660.1 LacI family transcriptional regulator [Sinorhizobium sp. LM21]ANK76854.1 LacI family transcriptional regulator [Ensifer adhaerens]KDP75429.1 LacI family transcriptional regulator [Ensifer adhaerens]KQX24753.1 LacI family transcriptional regulator [Ensifer sp. Root423]MBD9626491.1 substrate-binding domain-containing protein [Ensifer sp. ENS06]